MDLQWLQAFQTVARAGSFSAASRRLALSQSALSRQIQALEQHLGVPLFQRGPGGVQLTTKGERFLEFTNAILSLFRHAVEEVASPAVQAHTLRVAASSTPGIYLIPCALAEFRARHPDVRLTLNVSNSEDVEDALKTGNAELGIAGCPPSDPGLAAVPFTQIRIVLVSGEHGDGKPNLLLLRENGSCLRRVVEDLLRLIPEEDAPATLEIGSTESIKHVLACGVGAAYLPEVAVRSELAARVFRIIDHWPALESMDPAPPQTDSRNGLNRNLWFVFPKSGGPSREVLELMAIAVRRVRLMAGCNNPTGQGTASA